MQELLGRDRELRRLRQVLRGRTAGVLVSGSAGVGKTRLVREISRSVELGEGTGWAHGIQHRQAVPLGAFADFVDKARGPVGALGEIAGVADLVREQLTAASGRGLLVADDIHAFDEPSAAVLAHLIDADDVGVIATMRDDEELPPMVAMVVSKLEQLPLEPLGDEAVHALASSVAGAPLAPVAVARLQRLAAGNPLFVEELTRDACARGMLREDRDGLLRFTRAPEPSTELVSLVRARFDRLDDLARDALELIALAQPVSLTVTARWAPMPLLEELVRAGLVTVDRLATPAMVAMAHPLLTEVLLGTLTEHRHREHGRRLVEFLRGEETSDPVAVARWHLDSGADREADLLLEGARAALRRFDAGQAAMLARAAEVAGGGPEATLVLGEALAAGTPTAEEAEDVLATLEAEARDEDLLVRAATARARNLLFGLGRPDLAAKVAAGVVGDVDDPSRRAELRAVQGLSAMLLGDVGTAARVGEGVEVGRDVDARSVVTVRAVSTIGQVMLGQLNGVRALLDEARALLAELPREGPLALADIQLDLTRSYLDAYGGDLARAGDRARREVEAATARGEDASLALWLGMLGHVELLRGDFAGAVQHGADADALLVTQDLLRVRAQGICQRGVAAAGLGLREEAARALEQVREVEPEPPPRVAVHVGRLEAWLHILDGWFGAGVTRLVDAARLGHEGQHPVWAAMALYDAVQIGRADCVLADLETITADLDAELILAMVAHARAQAHADVEALRRAADRLWDAGAGLHAAQALLDAADVVASQGDEHRGALMRLAARRWLSEAAGQAWALQGRLEAPQLTTREQQVIELVAAGLSSRDVADRLVVSPRTVDNHLATIYRKLGLSGRRELRELLGPGPPESGMTT